jgi:hypothetical protein
MFKVQRKGETFMFEVQRKGETFKYLTLGTIINDNQVLKLSFKGPVEEFDLYLPTTFQHIIDSFKIGHLESDPNIATILISITILTIITVIEVIIPVIASLNFC